MIFKQTWLIEMHFSMFIIMTIDKQENFRVLRCLCFFIEAVGGGLENCKEPWYPYYFVMESILLCIEIVICFEIWQSVAKSYRKIFRCAVVILEIQGTRK